MKYTAHIAIILCVCFLMLLTQIKVSFGQAHVPEVPHRGAGRR